MKNILITICARGGSKGIPRKNIKNLAGKPLIRYSINHAKQFKEWLENTYGDFVRIELSTDDDEIMTVAARFGIKTSYTRPDFLANDTAGKLDAIKDAFLFAEKINERQFDYILDLDVSAPMRTVDDLKEAYTLFASSKEAINLFSVSNANKNPYFNMVEKNENGFWALSKKPESGAVLSRQTAPQVYEMNASFYFYKRVFFSTDKLYLFNKALVYKMKHESFDLDHVLDFDFLDYLILNNKLSFTL